MNIDLLPSDYKHYALMSKSEFDIDMCARGWVLLFEGTQYVIYEHEIGFATDHWANLDNEKYRIISLASKQRLTHFPAFINWVVKIAMPMMEFYGGKWSESKVVDYICNRARRCGTYFARVDSYDPTLNLRTSWPEETQEQYERKLV